MSNSNTNPANEEGTPKGGAKAAGIALGGTVALAGAAFLASQYFDEDSSSGSGSETAAEVKTDTAPVKEDVVWQQTGESTGSGIELESTDTLGSGSGNGQLSGSSFDDAFAEARAEHGGGGGHFSWNGDVYNTYTVEEWNTMSVEQRSDFVAGVVQGGGAGTEQVSGDYSAAQADSELESTTVLHENEEIIIPISEAGQGDDAGGSNLSDASAGDGSPEAMRGNDLSSADYILDSPEDSAIITIDPAQTQTQDVASIDVIEVSEEGIDYTSDIHDSDSSVDMFDGDWTA